MNIPIMFIPTQDSAIEKWAPKIETDMSVKTARLELNKSVDVNEGDEVIVDFPYPGVSERHYSSGKYRVEKVSNCIENNKFCCKLDLQRLGDVPAVPPKPTHADFGPHIHTGLCYGCERWALALDAWKEKYSVRPRWSKHIRAS